MSDRNIFDHSRMNQIITVQPYIEKLRKDYIKNGMSCGFREYFMILMEHLLAEIVEHEERPSWVNDIEDYRMKSEIVAFTLLLGSIEPNVEPTEEENDEFTQLYEDVKEFGKSHGWNLSILHLQFIRCMGTPLYSHLSTIVNLRPLDPIDYN